MSGWATGGSIWFHRRHLGAGAGGVDHRPLVPPLPQHCCYNTLGVHSTQGVFWALWKGKGLQRWTKDGGGEEAIPVF